MCRYFRATNSWSQLDLHCCQLVNPHRWQIGFSRYCRKPCKNNNKRIKVCKQNRGCPIIIWTGLSIKIGIVQKVYEWPGQYLAKMIVQGIFFAKGQLDHSYTFWTMPIWIFSPVYLLMRHPLHRVIKRYCASFLSRDLWYHDMLFWCGKRRIHKIPFFSCSLFIFFVHGRQVGLMINKT